MPTSFKPLLLGFGLTVAITAGAQAQSPTQTQSPAQAQPQATEAPRTSIANLPMPGPRPSSLDNIKQGPHMPIAQTGAYPGPNAGAANGQMPQHFEKPTGYDSNVAMHPYENGVGPKPN